MQQSYNKVLHRFPSAEEFAAQKKRMREKMLTFEQLEDQLAKSDEKRAIVVPLEKAIESAFRLYYLRDPSREDYLNCIHRFRSRMSSDEQAIEVIESGRIAPLLNIRPINMEMDVTNTCNIRCKMCYFSAPEIHRRKRSDMPIDRFRKLASQVFPGVNRLSLSFAVEPLIHPRLPEMVAIAKKQGVPKVYFATNGTLLTREKSERIVEAGLDAINFSIDAARKETYEMLRSKVRFENTITNIEALNRCKEQVGSSAPIVNFSFVLMKSNLEEVPDFIRMAHDLKAVSIHLQHLIPYRNLDLEKESLVHEKTKCNRILEEARKVAQELGITLLEPGDFQLGENGRETHPQSLKEGRAFKWFDLNLDKEDEARGCCPFPWHFLALAPQGNVQPCGWWYEDRFKADFEKNSFEEIWHGPEFSKLRERLMKNDLHVNCRSCPAVGMGDLDNPQSFSTQVPF